ncbi:MAG: efflux RND transporter permease subunit [Xanthomonadaceae bacterium]|nr:efflux RND transporter permease subunit [Xanthomonadaceae bacterium]
MMLSDLAVRRPVFATVVSLLLIVLGVLSFTTLPLRELPDIDPPVVSISTGYPGASAAIIETRITQLLEDAVSGIEGIDTLDSSSRNGESRITIEFKLSRDIEAAANDVRDAVSRVVDRLPEEADLPEVQKVSADADAILWLNLSSEILDTMALTDYAERYVVDRLSSIEGVAQVRIGGRQRYAMRIWLDRQALAARGLTVADVEAALRRENIELPAGTLESTTRDFTLRMERGFSGEDEFRQLPLVKGEDGYVVRLGDVAEVELGSEDRRAYFRGNGQPRVGLGIIKTSTANSLDVGDRVKSEMAGINRSLPEGMEISLAFDSTVFINVAVERVYKTLVEAVVLVLLVIWLFLGSARAALVPAVTVPVCLIAAFIGLSAFGFSINLLTLLALVLAIGLVVDDAIVVLENVQRRVDMGEPPALAAIRGTRQVAFAVIATTAVLISVFLPVAFLEGNNGRLFRELAVALAGAIFISAFVALTLTPMMCSKLVRPHVGGKGLDGWINARLNGLSVTYRRWLETLIGRRGLFALLMLGSVVLIGVLFMAIPRELAPPEDRGSYFASVSGPEGAGFDYTVKQMQEVERRLMAHTGEDGPLDLVISRVPGGFGAGEDMHTGTVIALLKPWTERSQSTSDAVQLARQDLADIPGIRAFPVARSGLVRSGGSPVQVVLGGPDYQEIQAWRDRLMARMEQNPGLFAIDSDYKETRPQIRVQLDSSRAADLGVSVNDVGRTLETMMGSRRVTTFIDDGEEYDVILQARDENRASPADLNNLYVRARGGELVPLSNVVTLSELAEPGRLNRFNRLRAITVSANLAPGYSLGEALTWVDQVVRSELPQTAQIDYKGESREYIQSGSAVLFTFVMALLVVYLVLAAQFESFLHPVTIMLTVPLAVLGALLGLAVTGSTLNLFSQIGIVMLVGLAAKNGILIVEFANQRRDAGLPVLAAILDASETRLRPILMTSLATMMGVLPLIIASGPGSASRSAVGVVVFFGVALSTFLSLFVVPSFYALLAPYTRSPDALARKIEAQAHAVPDREGKAPA